MMHDVPLLINITLALTVAFIGGVIARRIGLPTIVGYLLAGIAIGPFSWQGLAITLLKAAAFVALMAFIGVRLIPNSKSMTVFAAGDRIGVIGEQEQLEAVQKKVGVAD